MFTLIIVGSMNDHTLEWRKDDCYYLFENFEDAQEVTVLLPLAGMKIYMCVCMNGCMNAYILAFSLSKSLESLDHVAGIHSL